MLDLKLLRENPDLVKKGLEAKFSDFDLQPLLELDQERRKLITEVEQLKAVRNKASDEIAKLKKAGKPADAVISQMKESSQKIKDIDKKVGDLDEKMAELTYSIPNIPHNDVPVAPGDKGNKVVREWGKPRDSGGLKDHLDVATALGWFSMDRGSKITGSGFPVYQGPGAKLERALINFMIDRHSAHGYTEVWPPKLVNRKAMTGTGQLPKFEEDMYGLKDDDLFLIPTAEVPVTNLHADEIIEEIKLPIKYTAYTPCFRREAGSYGKDTRGLSRVHEFDKVELVKFVRPGEGLDELESLVADAEAVLQALELHYRVVLLGSGDLSFAAAKCYDIEVWAPATQKWFEVSSCSWFGDFQARRAAIRYRNEKTKKVEFVHTLNGSGVALARVVLCLLENCQTADGNIKLPKALESYMGNAHVE